MSKAFEFNAVEKNFSDSYIHKLSQQLLAQMQRNTYLPDIAMLSYSAKKVVYSMVGHERFLSSSVSQASTSY